MRNKAGLLWADCMSVVGIHAKNHIDLVALTGNNAEDTPEQPKDKPQVL